jgi:hypothetical protein
MNRLTQIKVMPTLDDLVTDPSQAKSLSSEKATDMLFQVLAIQPILMVQVVSSKGKEHLHTGDRLLKVDEVACRLNCDAGWVYRNTDKLPFTRRLSPSQLRFSEKGLEKYIENLLR